jgi:hypothetical protein
MPPDPADLDRFERDGYVVLPDALPATEVRRVRALTERFRRSETPARTGPSTRSGSSSALLTFIPRGPRSSGVRRVTS